MPLRPKIVLTLIAFALPLSAQADNALSPVEPAQNIIDVETIADIPVERLHPCVTTGPETVCHGFDGNLYRILGPSAEAPERVATFPLGLSNCEGPDRLATGPAIWQCGYVTIVDLDDFNLGAPVDAGQVPVIGPP